MNALKTDKPAPSDAAKGEVTGRPRRLIFRAWVVVTFILMIGSFAIGRWVNDDRIGFVFTAVIFPICTAALVFTALGWLVRLVFFSGRDKG